MLPAMRAQRTAPSAMATRLRCQLRRYLERSHGHQLALRWRGERRRSEGGGMRAVVLSEPGPVENLTIRELPLPPERDGWVRIRIEAFGLNRSELHTRLGLAAGVTFPRVPGIA